MSGYKWLAVAQVQGRQEIVITVELFSYNKVCLKCPWSIYNSVLTALHLAA